MAAYKRAKQKVKKSQVDQEPAKKLVRDVYIPEFITVKELANRMTEKSGDLIKFQIENLSSVITEIN